MINISSNSVLSAVKQAFVNLYEGDYSTEDPKLWKEEPALITIRGGLKNKSALFYLESNCFKCSFDYHSFFPIISKKVIRLEIDHWQKEFIKSDRLKRFTIYFKRHPSSKRAIIDLWDEKYRNSKKPVPCLIYLLFRKNRQKLEMHAHLRANNTLFNLLMDMHALMGIQQIVADKLGLKAGNYIHCVDSLIFFKRDFKAIKKQYNFIKKSLIWKQF